MLLFVVVFSSCDGEKIRQSGSNNSVQPSNFNLRDKTTPGWGSCVKSSCATGACPTPVLTPKPVTEVKVKTEKAVFPSPTK
jgi:hypothetical protein